MRQQHDESTLSDPLALSARDELVNDALRGVVEVSKLGLPAHQRVGVGHGEAELEAKNSVLGQGRVTDGVRGLVGVQVGKHIVLGLVNLNKQRNGLVSKYAQATGWPERCPKTCPPKQDQTRLERP